MSAIIETPKADLYRFGWRDVTTTMPDGTVRTKRVALTLKDCLHPLEGDHIVHGSDHPAIIRYLVTVLENHLYDKDAGALVTDDMGVYWDDPELDHHSPDIGVFFGVRDRDRYRPSFKVAAEELKPTVIIEVVSHNVRVNDVETKVDHYHRLEIPYYIIVDQKTEGGRRTLVGYRYSPTGYAPLPTDNRGRIWIEPLNVWIEAKGRSVVCYDGATNEPLPGPNEIPRIIEREAARVEMERVRAEKEKTRADEERINAEQEKTRADAAEARIRELEAKLAANS